MCIYHSVHTLSVLRAADGVLPAGPNGAESGAELVISADSIRVFLLGTAHCNDHLDHSSLYSAFLHPPLRF